MVNTILVLFGIVLIYLFIQMKKKAAWAKPAIIILSLVAIPVIWINMISRTREPVYRPDYRVYEIIGHELTATLGKYLTPGGKVIVFTPYSLDKISPKSIPYYYMKGFKSGFSPKNISIDKVISLPAGEIGMTIEEYNRQLQKFYNDKYAENIGIDGWISLGGLTDKPKELDVFSDTNPPKIGMIGGLTPGISSLIEKGFIHIVISETPKIHVVEKGEKISPKKMFQTRYMVVTPDNLNQIIERYPQIAPSSE